MKERQRDYSEGETERETVKERQRDRETVKERQQRQREL